MAVAPLVRPRFDVAINVWGGVSVAASGAQKVSEEPAVSGTNVVFGQPRKLKVEDVPGLPKLAGSPQIAQ